MSAPVALVTGASRGIGRAIASSFAHKGYDLILLARDKHALSELKLTLERDCNVTVRWIGVDVTISDDVRVQVQREIAAAGRLDVLVNSAGIFRFGTGLLPNEDFDALLATNVRAVHNLCVVCRDALKAADRSHIFNIASVAGLEGFAPIGGYVASKFALVGYGQSLASELLPANVRVTTLCPDVVDTDMSKASGMTAGQMISPDDICKAIDFVLSLSDSAIVDQLVIKCKTVLDMTSSRL
jgi:short-subunit dehydrogenase